MKATDERNTKATDERNKNATDETDKEATDETDERNERKQAIRDKGCFTTLGSYGYDLWFYRRD